MKRVYTDSKGHKHKIRDMHTLHLQNAINKLRRYRNPEYYEMIASLEREERKRENRNVQIAVDFSNLIKK